MRCRHINTSCILQVFSVSFILYTREIFYVLKHGDSSVVAIWNVCYFSILSHVKRTQFVASLHAAAGLG